MKKVAVTLACVCLAMCAYAQDHVVLKDGTDFDAAAAPVSYGYAQRYQRKTSFRGYFDAVGLVSKAWGGPGFTLSLGANIMDYVYVGLESGVDYMFVFNNYGGGSGLIVPLGVDTKEYIPTGNKNIVPYTELTIGAAFDGPDVIFHSYLGFGCQFSRFNASIGWDRMGSINSFGIKLGLFFGRK